MLAGGFNNVQNADNEVQAIIDQVRGEVEAQVGTLSSYQAISFTRQVVAGMNYKVKVQVSDQEYLHIKVYVPLPHTHNPPSLSQLERGKTLHDGL